MRRSGSALVAVFHCDFREDRKKDLRGLLSSVLFQLCDQSHSYRHILYSLYLARRHGAQRPSDDRLNPVSEGLTRTSRTSADLSDCRCLGQMSKYICSVVPTQTSPNASGGPNRLTTPKLAHMRDQPARAGHQGHSRTLNVSFNHDTRREGTDRGHQKLYQVGDSHE
jgi:hypothetical protein